MPGKNINNFSAWADSVEDDVYSISYTVNSLNFLLTEKYFPGVNLTELN
jgi:hypothetical protein